MARAISLAAGMPAPGFRGVALDGRIVDLPEFRPKPVLLEFHRGTW